MLRSSRPRLLSYSAKSHRLSKLLRKSKRSRRGLSRKRWKLLKLRCYWCHRKRVVTQRALLLLRKMLPRKKTTQSRLKSRMLSMKARRRMNRKVRVSRPLRSEPKKPRKRLRLLLRPPSRRPS